MTYPAARVGSLTKGGDEIIHGADTVFIEPAKKVSVTVNFQGKKIIFDEADIAHGEQDDPESDSGSMALGTGPNGSFTPQDAARSGSNQFSGGTGIDAALQANTTVPLPTDCSQIGSQIPYDMQLSPHFTLKDLSISAQGRGHEIISQRGQSISGIVCNLKALASNPLETLCNKYGRKNLLIASGFRQPGIAPEVTSGNGSQHEYGQAADVHMPLLSGDDFWAAAQWVQANVCYDQLILEIAGPMSQGHTPWLHISFAKEGNTTPYKTNRKQVLTFRGNKVYTPGLTRLF